MVVGGLLLYSGSMNQYVIAFTGHRPSKIGGYGQSRLRDVVVQHMEILLQTVIAEKENPVVMVGGALGVDTEGARIAYRLGVPYIVAAPCRDQDSTWPEESKRRYKMMLEYAQEVVFVHDGAYTRTCMQERNEYMVDHADEIIAVWDGSSGGTANCVKYARSQKKLVTELNPQSLIWWAE